MRALSSGQFRAGRITVGGFSTGIRGLLVPTLPPTAGRSAPELTVTNIEEEPDELIEMVAAGRIDASLIFDWNGLRGLSSAARRSPPQLITADRADIVMNRDHPLASRAEVGPGQTSSVEEFVSAPRRGGLPPLAHRPVRRRAQPNRSIGVLGDSNTTLRSSSSRAVGALALVPRLGRPHLPSDVTVVPLDDPAIARTIHLVWRQSMSSSPAIARLLEQMQAIAGADETAA
jgi:DNA-binding transcriptional LysR family regulator